MDPIDYDEPHPGEAEFDMGEGPAAQVGDMLDPIKPYIQHIVAAVIILAIVWFAYDYFFASLIEVKITLKNTEGELLRDSSLEIFAQGSAEPLFSEKNKATYIVSLKPGRYKFEAKSDDYGIEKSGFEVSQDEKAHMIELEQDLDVEIIEFEENVPDKMFVGGKTQLSVKLKNNSDKEREVELVAEKDIEGMVSTQKITISAGATETVEFELSIPSNTSVKDQKAGDKKEAVLRIKYTNEKESANFELFPNPAENISFNNLSLDASARENKDKDEGNITIKNSNKFAVENLTLTLEITSAPKNGHEEVLSWLQFSEIANEENSHEIEIANIIGSGSVRKELQLVVPLTAKKELDIKGNIILNAPYFPEPINKTLTISVKEEAEFGISLSLSQSSPIEIKWDDDIGLYENEDEILLEVKNDGQIDLKNLTFLVENDEECSLEWFEIKTNHIDQLPVGRTEELMLNISAPTAVRTHQGGSVQCNIEYRYDDPVKTTEKITKLEEGFLKVVAEPIPS